MTKNQQIIKSVFDKIKDGIKLSFLSESETVKYIAFIKEEKPLFNLMLFPGYLAITSCNYNGVFVFKKDVNFIDFFLHSNKDKELRIDPGYWAEKIVDGRNRAYAYSPETAKESVLYELFVQNEELLERYFMQPEFTDNDVNNLISVLNSLNFEERFNKVIRGLIAVRDEILPNIEKEEDFINSVYKFTEFEIDLLEFNLKDFSLEYLWCCYCIVFGLKKYLEIKGELS